MDILFKFIYFLSFDLDLFILTEILKVYQVLKRTAAEDALKRLLSVFQQNETKVGLVLC